MLKKNRSSANYSNDEWSIGQTMVSATSVSFPSWHIVTGFLVDCSFDKKLWLISGDTDRRERWGWGWFRRHRQPYLQGLLSAITSLSLPSRPTFTFQCLTFTFQVGFAAIDSLTFKDLSEEPCATFPPQVEPKCHFCNFCRGAQINLKNGQGGAQTQFLKGRKIWK